VKEGFFFDRIDMDSTGLSVYKAIKRAVFIHPRPALAVLAILKHTLIGTHFALNPFAHTYIIKRRAYFLLLLT
jgi:hypothetical protein